MMLQILVGFNFMFIKIVEKRNSLAEHLVETLKLKMDKVFGTDGIGKLHTVFYLHRGIDVGDLIFFLGMNNCHKAVLVKNFMVRPIKN